MMLKQENWHWKLRLKCSRLNSDDIEQNQDTGELLIDIVNNLPEITCFNHQDPLEIQKSLRDEWN
jgi:hypothetical protein